MTKPRNPYATHAHRRAAGPMHDRRAPRGGTKNEQRELTEEGADLDELFALARKHGEESEPDHEVGDLQDLARMLWERASEADRRAVAAVFRGQLGTSS